MNQFHPKGRRLPALERNILKYRAFEMTIILFEIEDLKAFVLDSIRATDRTRLPAEGKASYKRMWAVLVSDGVLSHEESDDIQRLIDYRNLIAHRIQELTSDVSRTDAAFWHREFNGVQYDYDAMEKVEAYRFRISERMSKKFIISLSFRPLLFESAKATYKHEMGKLRKTIERLFRARQLEVAAANSELERFEASYADEIQPGHPQNRLANGRLSARGVDCCYRLFSLGFSDLAVSHLMRVSYASVRSRRAAAQMSTPSYEVPSGL